VIPAELTSPGEAPPCDKTHYLIREDGKTVLRRHHFDCGFCGCKHGRSAFPGHARSPFGKGVASRRVAPAVAEKPIL